MQTSRRPVSPLVPLLAAALTTTTITASTAASATATVVAHGPAPATFTPPSSPAVHGAKATCPPHSDAKVIDTGPLTLDQIVTELADADAAGHDVARLHSGDPSLYSALAEQCRRLGALHIDLTACGR